MIYECMDHNTFTYRRSVSHNSYNVCYAFFIEREHLIDITKYGITQSWVISVHVFWKTHYG